MDQEKLLDDTIKWDFSRLEKSSYNTYIHDADEFLPLLFEQWGETNDKPEYLEKVINSLKTWDRIANTEDINTSIYYYMRLSMNAADDNLIQALENGLKTLQQVWERYSSGRDKTNKERIL